jgi:hypothetical protein
MMMQDEKIVGDRCSCRVIDGIAGDPWLCRREEVWFRIPIV